jgi:hypothetical protein
MKRWFLGGLLLAAGCSSAPSEEQCRQLLEHLVDLEFKKSGATASGEQRAELAKQKQAVSDTAQREFLQVCADKTDRQRIECALAATDLDAVAKCDEAK